jgi:hypothetical protein
MRMRGFAICAQFGVLSNGDRSEHLRGQVAIMGFVVRAQALHIQRQAKGHDAAPELPKPQLVAATHEITADVQETGIPIAWMSACRPDIASKDDAGFVGVKVNGRSHGCSLSQGWARNRQDVVRSLKISSHHGMLWRQFQASWHGLRDSNRETWVGLQ